MSIAAIALRHELNANLLRRWVAQACVIDGEERQEDGPTNTGLETFVPVAIAPHAATEPATIEVEIKRGALAVRINWPVSAASQCGAWLRELLR